jgi:hypothetical protein
MSRNALASQVLTIGTIAALLVTSVAQAATIANRDDKDVKVTVIEGPTREDRIIPPGKAIEGICQKGCIIRLNDNENDEYELEGPEHVSVEDGFLYYDGPDAEGAPNSGSTDADGNTP